MTTSTRTWRITIAALAVVVIAVLGTSAFLRALGLT